ncbi:MAG: hypothetical protein GY847_00025 [Proteobacteria bacterium]|nr:hypothetical protein [Pseudomonadota bacterium]
MSHPPQFELDRLAAKELAPEDANEIRAHLEGCLTCRAYLKKIDDEQEAIVSRTPPMSFAYAVEEKMTGGKVRSRASHTWTWGLSTAAVAAVILAVYLIPSSPEKKTNSMRWMGSPVAAKVYLKRDGQSQLLDKQTPIPGDRLRFEVIVPPGKKMHAVLVATEGNRTSSILPDRPESGPYPVSGAKLLPGSVEVERGGGTVILRLIVRSEPFRIDELLKEVASKAGPSSEKPEISGLVHRLVVEPGSP